MWSESRTIGAHGPASIVTTGQSAIWKHHREPAVPGNGLAAACCCEMKRGVLRGGRRLFVELEEVVIYLFTNQHTRSLSSPLLTPYWKQPSDMSSVMSEPGGSDWDWRAIGRRLSREQLLWLGKLAKACQRR